MEISLEVGLNMIPKLPKNKIVVAESGLFTSEDLEKMARAGARCFLIGEALMQYHDVTEATKLLLSKPYKMVG
jgi:indole-3-glycerol phosphate synthase